jgi:putative spermidine/putrescine transport system permease protein
MSAMSRSEPVGPSQRVWGALLRVYVAIATLFLLGPILAVTLGSLTRTQYVVFPPKGLTLAWYGKIFERPEMLSSFGLSLAIAACAATIATLVSLLVALVLVRRRSRLGGLLWLLVVSPMMLPAIVLGFAFLQTYTWLGFGNSVAGLLAGHIVLVTPYAVALATTGLRSVDPTLEEAARSLGASQSRTLRLVTLPVRIFDALRYSPLNPQLTALTSTLVILTVVVLVGAAALMRPERLFGGAQRNAGRHDA